MHTKDLQKIKKKTKIHMAIDEGWNSQKQLSVSVEKEEEYPHPKLSLGLVPYRPFTLK